MQKYTFKLDTENKLGHVCMWLFTHTHSQIEWYISFLNNKSEKEKISKYLNFTHYLIWDVKVTIIVPKIVLVNEK